METSSIDHGSAAGDCGRLDSGSRPQPPAAAPRSVIRGENPPLPPAPAETPFDGIASGEIYDGELYRSVLDAARGLTFEREPLPLDGAGEVAHIDWIAGTIGLEAIEREGFRTDEVGWLLRRLEQDHGIPVDAWNYTGSGWQGYERRLSAEGFGLVAYGGETQKGSVHFEITGEGCSRITDWERFRAMGEAWAIKLTRLDLAHDDFDGERVSVALALGWLAEGGFSARGRRPKSGLYDDLGSGEGKTLNVGHRKNGKMCRVYEKGRQLGDVESPWTRVEVEWRARDRVIPWEAVTTPGPYLAGAYPCLAFLDQVQVKIRTVKKQVEITMERLIGWLRTAAGKGLNAVIRYHQGDIGRAFACVIREGFPKRLGGLGDYLGEAVHAPPLVGGK